MVSAAALLLALATLSWPAARSPARLRAVLGVSAEPAGPSRVPKPTTAGLALLAGAAGWVVGGMGGGIAAALAIATGWRRWTARRTTRRTLAAVDGLAEALRSMVAELRAGAHPATAAESAAVDAEPHAAWAMAAVAAAARRNGDVERALAAGRGGASVIAQVLGQLSRAWSLVQRHGLPLAEVLDAVCGDLEARARFARQVQARMAGPRASATILALLPAVGIALGEAMGARPVHVLTGTGPGQLLLVLGVGLACAGVAWSARLTGQVVLL
ncbi:MAG: type II secretion system F family protein [Labedaea sp.]